jgi:hypothetical protein
LSKHTPGPWAIRQDPKAGPLYNWNVGIDGRPQYWIQVAVCSEHDARLISAAPELLAACLEVAQGYTTRGSEMARAAIAKATGEQS